MAGASALILPQTFSLGTYSRSVKKLTGRKKNQRRKNGRTPIHHLFHTLQNKRLLWPKASTLRTDCRELSSENQKQEQEKPGEGGQAHLMQAKIRPLDKLCLGLGRGLVSEKAKLMQGLERNRRKWTCPDFANSFTLVTTFPMKTE